MFTVVREDGSEFGPVDLATLGSWAAEGRLHPSTEIIDIQTARRFQAAEHLYLRNRIAPSVLAVAAADAAKQAALSGEIGGVPTALPRWNWGAFGLTTGSLGWLWLFNHNQPALGGVMLILFLIRLYCMFILRSDTNLIIVNLLSTCELGVGIYLGVCGYELAWKNRSFVDVDDCRACQRAWGWGALAYTVFLFALGIAAVAFFINLDSARNSRFQ